MAKRRRRGVVLTPEGLERFQAARLKSEAEENYGERYTYEKLSDITYLDIHTIKRVTECQEGVDKRTLERLFISFDIELSESCYTKPNPHRRQHWGESMCVANFFGRTEELNILESLLLKDRCRIVTLLGMGGMGKTCISVKLARQIQERFDLVMWCSLRDAPPAIDIVTRIVEFLSDGKETAADLPESLKDKTSRLIEYLKNSRCLIVLDNLESLLCGDKRAGLFREGYEEYGDLLRRLGETEHLSSVLLTTREKPKEVAFMEGENLPVRTFRVFGLEESAGEKLLKTKGLSGSESSYRALINYYGGNALALKVVATTIKDLFQGDINDFLEHETAVFGDIRDLLEQQFNRLTKVEQEIVYWLAINREPMSIGEVRDDMVSSNIAKTKLLEAVESLTRRSLVERDDSCFTLQNVVMEYVLCRFVERVAHEIVSLDLELFRYHAVIKATAKDYVRETQIRLILEPIIDELESYFKSKKNIIKRLDEVLALLREKFSSESCYAGGNLINMLCHMNADFTSYDFSGLAVWQADFRNSCFHHVNLAHADLSKSIFSESFGGIWSVAFSPDGKLLATGDTKGEIILRRVSDGQIIRSFKEHSGWIVSLDFSADGETLASSSTDCLVKLWDTNTGKCLHTLKEHEHEVWSVAFSPDGKILASGCDDNKVRLWNVDTGECLKILNDHTNCVLSVAFNSDGKEMLTGSHDHTIRLWNVDTGECKRIFQGNNGIRSILVQEDKRTFISSGNDPIIRLWDVDSGECIRTFEGHSNVILSIALCKQSNILASGSVDHTIRLWDINTGECLKVFQGHSNWISSVTFNRQGNFLASGSYDQTVKFWNINTYQCFKTFQGYSNQSLSVTFNTNGKILASGGYDQKVNLWDVNTGQVFKTFEGHSNSVWSIAFNSQNNLLASGGGDKTVKLWNVDSGNLIKTLEGHQAVVRSVAFSSDNQTIASGSEDRTIRLWNINTGQTIIILQEHQAEIWSIAFSTDGQMLASGSLDGTAKLWNVNTGNCLRTFKEHTNWVTFLAFSPDNKTLATTSPDQTIRLWNISDGECKGILKEDRGASHLVAFSYDGKVIATCNQDYSIRLWSVDTKKCFLTISGHKSFLNSIAFCSDNKTLVSSSEDETIRLWSIESGECLKTLKIEKPYHGMNLLEAHGLTEANIDALQHLGAVAN